MFLDSALVWAMRYQASRSSRFVYGTVYSRLWAIGRSLIHCGFLLDAAALAKMPPEPVLQIFLRSGPEVFLPELRLRGPAPVSAEAKREILRALPAEGEVKVLSAPQRNKVASLSRIFDLHDRASVYVVKVVEVPQAILALHARCVLLISEPGLAIWSAEELQALAAHEIGHEYVWEKYYDARAGNRLKELQQLELYCDGISIMTLTAAGLDPSNLTSAVKKGICYNRAHLGVARNESSYPDFGRRASFHKALIQWIAEYRAEYQRALDRGQSVIPARNRLHRLARLSYVAH